MKNLIALKNQYSNIILPTPTDLELVICLFIHHSNNMMAAYCINFKNTVLK